MDTEEESQGASSDSTEGAGLGSESACTGTGTYSSEGGAGSDSDGGAGSDSEAGAGSDSDAGAGSESEGGASPTAAQNVPITAYEASRLANIERDNKKLENLRLPALASEVRGAVQADATRGGAVSFSKPQFGFLKRRSTHLQEEPQEEEVRRITRSRRAASPTSLKNPSETKAVQEEGRRTRRSSEALLPPSPASQTPKGKLVLSEPARWEIRRQSSAKSTVEEARLGPSKSSGTKFAVPQSVQQQGSTVPKEARNMSTSVTWLANDEDEHDFLEEDTVFEDFTPPIARRFDGKRYPGSTSEVGMDDYASMDLKIMSKELEMLKVQRAQKQRQAAKLTPEAVGGEEYDGFLQSLDVDKRHRRRLHSRQQQQEAPVREQQGRRRYTVEVDMKGNPCGANRHLWLKCLQGHAVDLDFSVDNYNDHNAKTLLNIKNRVDNTFEYEGGIGNVTEWSFHANLKSQLKMKRYAMKKLMVVGREKPNHIRQDHWLNLSELIADGKKVKQAETLTQNRAHLKRLSHAGRSEGEVTANLAVELQRDPSREEIEHEMQRQKPRKKQPVGTSNVSHISATASRVQVPSPSLEMEVKSMKRDFYTRMDGIEASVKAIMTALKIPPMEDRNTSNVPRPSSFEQRQSPPNLDSMAPDQSSGENISTSQRLGRLKQSTSQCLLNQGKKRKARSGSPLHSLGPELEKENEEEVRSGSREKAVPDVAGDKEGGIGVPKKRSRATKLQKRQIGIEEPQMPRKLRGKQYVEKDSEKIGKAPVETRRAGKDKVVEEKQPPLTAKIVDVKAVKEKDSKGDDGGKRPPKKGIAKTTKEKVTLKEVEAVPPFASGDLVKIMGVGIDEESLLVGDGRVMSLPGGTVHGVVISEGIVSVQVLQSHDDAYLLYQSIMLDDPPVTKMGDAVGHFILWPTECLQYSPEA